MKHFLRQLGIYIGLILFRTIDIAFRIAYLIIPPVIFIGALGGFYLISYFLIAPFIALLLRLFYIHLDTIFGIPAFLIYGTFPFIYVAVVYFKEFKNYCIEVLNYVFRPFDM